MAYFGRCAFLFFVAANAVAAPVITFSSTGVEATGIRAGGDAVWLSAAIEPFNGSIRLSDRVEVTRDEDGDGRVTLDVDVKPYSLWIAVDYATGQYAIARPDGSSVRVLVDRGDRWAGGATFLDFFSSDAHVLLVRPEKGAWISRVAQGAAGDGDGHHDANLRVTLDAMTHLHGEKNSPPFALPKDLLVVVDTHELSVFVREARELH